jgi:uncharacterized membrane protein YdjX (TVP38/TMEM64 family)
MSQTPTETGQTVMHRQQALSVDTPADAPPPTRSGEGPGIIHRKHLGAVKALGLLALGAMAALLFGDDAKGLFVRALDFVRSTGPAVFFLSMAVLPIAGAPLSLFTLTVGLLFGPQLGMPAVLALSLAAITANMALGYLLANRALRPFIARLLRRRGYELPALRFDGANSLIVLLRATPGVPFPVQNYLLGLAAIPFTRYLLVSGSIVLPLNAAIILFGEALLQGKGQVALTALLLLLTIASGIHFIRKRLASAVAETAP